MRTKLLLLAIIVALVSCKKDDDDNSNPSASSFLTVGHEWSYDYTMDMEGIEMTGTLSYEVLEDLGNGSYKVQQTISIAGFPDQTFTETWTEEDAFGIGVDLSDVSVGDTFTDTEGGVTYTTTVESINESKTVPAGTFNCIKLKGTQSDDPDLISYYYFNESYGMIYADITTIEEGMEVNIIMQLKSKNF